MSHTRCQGKAVEVHGKGRMEDSVEVFSRCGFHPCLIDITQLWARDLLPSTRMAGNQWVLGETWNKH